MNNNRWRFKINSYGTKKVLGTLGSIMLYSVMMGSFLFFSSKIILGNDNKNTEKSKIESDLKESIIIKDTENKDKSQYVNLNFNVRSVKVYITKENRIEELPLEEYIKGVVSSEMPISFEMEALKAQAIAARTYALAHIKPIGSGCANAHGADLCDTTHCHVYTDKGKKIEQWTGNGTSNWSKIETAVNETQGMVLTYNGELAKGAYYFSTSSGKTENVEEVFSSNIPYLRSVESKGEEIAPRYKSSVTMTKAEFVTKINSSFKNANLKVNTLEKSIKIISNTKGGSVKDIKVGNEIIKGTEMREVLGLNSANFRISMKNKNIEFDCTGFGHGVGMSQWGANVMAKEGNNYIDILKHYYSNIELGKIN